MVFEGCLRSARGERASGDEVFDELVVLRERRGNVEGSGVLSNESDFDDV